MTNTKVGAAAVCYYHQEEIKAGAFTICYYYQIKHFFAENDTPNFTRISTRGNDQQFHCEIASKLLHPKTIFEVQMNNFDFFIIENKVIAFKNVNLN